MPDPRDSGDRNRAPERLAALTWPRRVGRARAWLGQRPFLFAGSLADAG